MFPDMLGKPLIFPTPQEFQAAMVGYFSWCDSQNNEVDKNGKTSIKEPYLISGLCDYIGITKETYYQYAKKPEYDVICTMAKQKIETFILKNGSLSKTNVIMNIVNLKNNFGYTDKVDINTNQSVETLDVHDIKKMLNESNRNVLKQLNE